MPFVSHPIGIDGSNDQYAYMQYFLRIPVKKDASSDKEEIIEFFIGSDMIHRGFGSPTTRELVGRGEVKKAIDEIVPKICSVLRNYFKKEEHRSLLYFIF